MSDLLMQREAGAWVEAKLVNPVDPGSGHHSLC